jgi:DNA-binding NarL/FixJ family response regulator
VITGLLASQRPTSHRVNVLTRRERQILKLVAEGHDTRQIAKYISLSDKTVAKHRSNLMRKLDLHCVADLTRFAMENGLLANTSA